jgi:hypothetical protein
LWVVDKLSKHELSKHVLSKHELSIGKLSKNKLSIWEMSRDELSKDELSIDNCLYWKLSVIRNNIMFSVLFSLFWMCVHLVLLERGHRHKDGFASVAEMKKKWKKFFLSSILLFHILHLTNLTEMKENYDFLKFNN